MSYALDTRQVLVHDFVMKNIIPEVDGSTVSPITHLHFCRIRAGGVWGAVRSPDRIVCGVSGEVLWGTDAAWRPVDNCMIVLFVFFFVFTFIFVR